MMRAHILRAARNFATSSNRLLCELKKKLSRGAKLSMASPASSAARTYVSPSASVNASSCTAVAPASRMWYPEIEIVFHSGTSTAAHAKISVTSRIACRTGKM